MGNEQILENWEPILASLVGWCCVIRSGSGAGEVCADDPSGSRASSLWSQHVPKPLCTSLLLNMQAFAVLQDKNTLRYACNLGLKVSRADSKRNGKSIKSLLFLFPYALWTIKTQLKTPPINSITFIDTESVCWEEVKQVAWLLL